MKRVSFQEYLIAPVGNWTCGEGWAHFSMTSPYLAGAITWDGFGKEACEALLACSAAARVAMPKHLAFLDASRTGPIDAITFRIASEYILRNRKSLRAAVSRFAGVRPRGFAGASAEGFFRVVPSPYPFRVFNELLPALKWLGHEELATTIDEIQKLAVTSEANTTLVADLCRELSTDLNHASVAWAAKRLNLSVRSLQRGLYSQGTSFQRELTGVRVRTAQSLMLETNLSLTEIALESGFASSATFSFVFKKLIGVSPSAWRENMSVDKRRG